MARRPFQLLAALFLVAGVLGVSTALIDELREEVVQAAPREPSFEFDQPTASSDGLPIRRFTLLDPAPAEIPHRTITGNTLRLTGNGTLHLDAGDRIEIAPIPVPAEARARFPQGAEVDDGTIRCPAGCSIEVADRTVPVLPNGSLHLPGDASGPIQGQIAPGDTLSVPPGTMIHLDPLTMPAATPLPLLPGAKISLPSTEPAPPPGSPGRLDLPAGTTVEGPANGSATARDLAGLAGERPRISAEDVDLLRATRPDVTITDWPDAIRKGAAFQVSGHVTLPNGTPLAEHPITLYANETKRTPGMEIQIGTVATNDTGHFTATARLPEDAPTQPYHLVAEAHARPEHDPPLANAFSDPIVPVEGKARLAIQVPAREGIQIPLPIQLDLTDRFGAPVPNQSVTVELVGGGWIGQAITDGQGEATVVAKDGLPEPGTWTLRARFPGTEHIRAATASTEIEGVYTRIETPPTLVVPRDSHVNVTGRVLREDASSEDVELVGRMGEITARTRTGPGGHFTLPLDVPARTPVGNHTLTLETTGVTAERTIVVTVTGQLTLTADPPDALPLGGTLPLTVTAENQAGEPLSGIPVQVRSGELTRRSITGADGDATLPVPLAGRSIDVHLSSPGTSLYAATSRTMQLDAAPLSVTGDLAATLEEPYETTIRLSAGGPMANTPFRLVGDTLDLRATTDRDGRAELTLSVPAGTELGPHQARLDLPRFNTLHPVTVDVLDQPTLDIQILETGEEGAPLTVRVDATGRTGPLEEIPITVTADGAFHARASGFTGPGGTAEMTIDRPSDAEGAVSLTVQAERTGRTASVVQVQDASVTAAPFPWWTLVGLVPVAGAGLAYARYRRKDGTTSNATAPGPTIRLTLQEQDPTWPTVWHPGEPATLEVTLVDEQGDPLPRRTLELAGPEGRRRVETGEAGTARIRLPPHGRGAHAYTARFDGERGHPATEATVDVRIVDYREEIDREYRDLKRDAVDANLCGEDVTPRELAAALGRTAEADRLAQLFERCDYSPRPVGRDHYERFMRAKGACRLDGQGPG